MRNWDVCRITYKIKIQWLGWLDLSKSSVVTMRRKVFHCPNHRAIASSHPRRWGKDISSRFPSRQVCPGWRSEAQKLLPAWEGWGRLVSLSGQEVSQPHIPPQDLTMTSLSSATLSFLASLTPIHRFSFSPCFMNSAPSYVCCLSKQLM